MPGDGTDSRLTMQMYIDFLFVHVLCHELDKLCISSTVPIVADVVTVLGHPAVHAPSHSDGGEQAEHAPPADDGGLVARGSPGGRLLPPSPPDTLVSSP